MLLTGSGRRAGAHRCRARMLVRGAEEVPAHRAVEADQLNARSRNSARRHRLRRRARVERGTVLRGVPVHGYQRPLAWCTGWVRTRGVSPASGASMRTAACRSARRMISSSSRSMRCRRVTEHRLRRCRRQSHPNSCIGGGPVGSHGGAGRRETAVGRRSRRQRPCRAWRWWERSELLVPAVGWLTRTPQALAGRASGPVTAPSRMVVVAESSVAPPCDEASREDTSLKHPQLFPDRSASFYPRSGQAHDHSTAHPSGTAAGSRQQAAGSRQQAAGSRQQAAGSTTVLGAPVWPRGIRG